MKGLILFAIATIGVIWWQDYRNEHRVYTFPDHPVYQSKPTYDELYDAHLTNEADY